MYIHGYIYIYKYTYIGETIEIFRRRVIDIAACLPTINVTFNDEIIKIDSFQDYISLFDKKTDIKAEVCFVHI
jgi:hypothetical protein